MRFFEILCEADVPPDVLRDGKTGQPKLLYHGTVDAFSQFDPRKVHDKDGIRLKLGFGPGVLYFTDHPEDAYRYAARSGKEGVNIRPVFLIMHKPLLIKRWDDDNAGWLNNAACGRGSFTGIKSYAARMRKFIRDVRAEGFDGIIQDNNKPPREYVVFAATQVISAFDTSVLALRRSKDTPS